MAGKKGINIGKKKKVELVERKNQNLNEKIVDLEKQIGKTKYNKRTQHAVGLMKAKLAMLKQKATQRSSAGKGAGDDRFNIRKTGDATCVLLGFPSVGKSTLLNKITMAKSDIGAYNFTTLSAVPGLLNHKFAKIQIIDVPGIVSGAASGRGRGKEVLSMLRSADLAIILIDAIYPQHHEAILKEIYETDIRLNQKKPYVKITKKDKGGIAVGTTIKLTKTDKATIESVTKEFRISNADILIREDINIDQFIDILEGNKKYTKALVIITKIDLISKEKLKEISSVIKPDLCISAEKNIAIEELKETIYKKLGFIRIFLKEVNKKPDLEEPLIMFKNCTIEDVCNKLHRDFSKKFKFARLWANQQNLTARCSIRWIRHLEIKIY